jgi:hypothetical protein
MVPPRRGSSVVDLATIATHAPSAANFIAIASPIPLLAPVIKATLPLSIMSCIDRVKIKANAETN